MPAEGVDINGLHRGLRDALADATKTAGMVWEALRLAHADSGKTGEFLTRLEKDVARLSELVPASTSGHEVPPLMHERCNLCVSGLETVLGAFGGLNSGVVEGLEELKRKGREVDGGLGRAEGREMQERDVEKELEEYMWAGPDALGPRLQELEASLARQTTHLEVLKKSVSSPVFYLLPPAEPNLAAIGDSYPQL